MVLTFFLAIFWSSCFIHGLVNEKIEPLKFSDKFDIGYIEGDDQVVVIDQPKKKKKKKKKHSKTKSRSKAQSKPAHKPKPAPKPKRVADESLVRDCVSALSSLGTSKAESKRAAKEFLLSNPDITTVEQFIEGIFKKG